MPTSTTPGNAAGVFFLGFPAVLNLEIVSVPDGRDIPGRVYTFVRSKSERIYAVIAEPSERVYAVVRERAGNPDPELTTIRPMR